MFFKKSDKKIETLQESFKAFKSEIRAMSNEEISRRNEKFRIGIITAQEVCEELKEVLPLQQRLQALKLEIAIKNIIENSSEIYRLGVEDSIDYVNYAIKNEHYKTVNK